MLDRDGQRFQSSVLALIFQINTCIRLLLLLLAELSAAFQTNYTRSCGFCKGLQGNSCTSSKHVKL